MKINRYYQFRLYPTKEQEQILANQFGCCRFVYNYFLQVRKDAYEKKGQDALLRRYSEAAYSVKAF